MDQEKNKDLEGQLKFKEITEQPGSYLDDLEDIFAPADDPEEIEKKEIIKRKAYRITKEGMRYLKEKRRDTRTEKMWEKIQQLLKEQRIIRARRDYLLEHL